MQFRQGSKPFKAMGESTNLTQEIYKEDTEGDLGLACTEVSSQKKELSTGTLIEKSNGLFSFHYGLHLIPLDPDDLPDSDAVVLEAIGLEGLHNHYAAEPEENPLSVLRSKRWYRDLFKHWEGKGGMRIFLVDIDQTLKSAAKSLELPVVEGLAGVGIAELNQVVHPELLDLTLSFRNCLFAHKLDRIAQQIGGCPRIMTILGAAHTGLEDKMLEPPEARLDYFRKIKPRLAGEIAVPESLYTIAEMRYDPSNDRWYRADLFEDQALREVFKNT